MKFPELEPDKLILRETTLSDAEAIFQIFSDNDVTQYHNLDTTTDINQVTFLIQQREERFRNKQGIRWGIARKEDNIIIGSCGFSYGTSFNAEIGYELAKSNWRKGYMTEALKAIIMFGFEKLEFNRIQALVMLENQASIKLLEKLKFTQEGVLRDYGYWKEQYHDLKMFSILKREFIKLS